jgi:NTE family protein
MNHDDQSKNGGGARRSRALVLGAGGPVGRAWQSGLIAGLIEREVDLGDASSIIGTSAGAIVGATMALGLKFAAPSKRDLTVQTPPASSSSNLPALLTAIARAVRSSEPEVERAKIGAFAIAAQTPSEEDSIARPGLRADPGTFFSHAIPRDGGERAHREASGLGCFIRRHARACSRFKRGDPRPMASDHNQG